CDNCLKYETYTRLNDKSRLFNAFINSSTNVNKLT
ncbi:unnamed protein product, partial [Rotaria sp. Silwood1]